MAGFTPSGGDPNVPGWTQDGVISGDGVTSVTHNLSAEYDHVKLVALDNYDGGDPDALDVPRPIDLQLNGITTADYDYVDKRGSRTSGVTAVPIDDIARMGEIIISGRSESDFELRGSCRDRGKNTTNPQSFRLGTTGLGALSSITISQPSNNSFDVRVDVYGRTR